MSSVCSVPIGKYNIGTASDELFFHEHLKVALHGQDRRLIYEFLPHVSTLLDRLIIRYHDISVKVVWLVC